MANADERAFRDRWAAIYAGLQSHGDRQLMHQEMLESITEMLLMLVKCAKR